MLVALWIKDDDPLAVQSALNQEHGGHDAFARAGGSNNLHMSGVEFLPRDVNRLAPFIQAGKDPLFKGEIAVGVVSRPLGLIKALANIGQSVIGKQTFGHTVP